MELALVIGLFMLAPASAASDYFGGCGAGGIPATGWAGITDPARTLRYKLSKGSQVSFNIEFNATLTQRDKDEGNIQWTMVDDETFDDNLIVATFSCPRLTNLPVGTRFHGTATFTMRCDQSTCHVYGVSVSNVRLYSIDLLTTYCAGAAVTIVSTGTSGETCADCKLEDENDGTNEGLCLDGFIVECTDEDAGFVFSPSTSCNDPTVTVSLTSQVPTFTADTILDWGDGIAVNSLSIVSPQLLRTNISISPSASTGTRIVHIFNNTFGDGGVPFLVAREPLNTGPRIAGDFRVGPVYRGTYYAPTGKLVRSRPRPGSSGAASPESATITACYTDTDTTGFFGTGALTCFGDEWLDWGIVGGTSGTDCSSVVNSAILGQFTFGYATATLDVASGGPGQTIAVNFYSGTIGTSGDSANQNCVYSACFSGLPGHNGNTAFGTAWMITVSLTGGAEVCLPDGPFGFGLQQGDSGSFFGGAFSNCGPLNVQAGGGTDFVPDTNGNVDFFAIWSPDSKTGSFVGNTFGFAASDHAAWYLTLAKANLGTLARAVVRNPRGNQSSYALTGSPGRLGGTMSLAITNISGQRNNFLIIGVGPVSASLGSCVAGLRTLYCGTILDVLLLGPNPTNLRGFPNAKDVSLCGVTLCTQALHLGGVRPYCLSNAIDITFGG